MKLPEYIHDVCDGLLCLQERYQEFARIHTAEFDVQSMCNIFAENCKSDLELFRSSAEQYGNGHLTLPSEFVDDGLAEDSLGLLRDLEETYVTTARVSIGLTILKQAAQALTDQDFTDTVSRAVAHLNQQSAWVETRIKQAAPQYLIATNCTPH